MRHPINCRFDRRFNSPQGSRSRLPANRRRSWARRPPHDILSTRGSHCCRHRLRPLNLGQIETTSVCMCHSSRHKSSNRRIEERASTSRECMASKDRSRTGDDQAARRQFPSRGCSCASLGRRRRGGGWSSVRQEIRWLGFAKCILC